VSKVSTPDVQSTKSNDDITEEEFDSLLGGEPTQMSVVSTSANLSDDCANGRTESESGAESRPESSATTEEAKKVGKFEAESITDDEFDELLIQLNAESVKDANPTSKAGVAEGGASETSDGGKGFVVDLGDEQTIASASQLYGQLAAWPATDSSAVIDGQAIERIDTAALQLLLAFKFHVEGHGRKFEWLATSENLVASAALLGLSSHLDL
jgi:phospholipid transport system transporter-binding protein